MSELTSVADLPSVRDYTPLDFLEANVPPLVWGMNLPASIDAERVVVNMDALHRYQRVGAIGSSLVLEYQGDQTEFTPGVSGINGDGSAMATKAGTIKKADQSQAEILDPITLPSFVVKEFGHPLMLHRLNKAEMVSKISDDVRAKGLSREEAWAKQLDASFRDSFRRGGSKHLKDRIGSLAVLDYTLFSYLGATVSLEVATGDALALAISTGAWAGFHAAITTAQAALLKHTTGSTHLREKRWSMFYANHQTDRYMALNAMSRFPGLISARK